MKEEKLHNYRNDVGTPSPLSAGGRGDGSLPTHQKSKNDATGLVNSHISHRFDVLDSSNLPNECLDSPKRLAMYIDHFKSKGYIRNFVIATKNGVIARVVRVPFRKNKKVYSSRGEIKGFSKNSRRRMIDIFQFIDWEVLKAESKNPKKARGLFITLTYPETDFSDWHLWKKHLDSFRKRMVRYFGNDIAALWKLENQEKRARKMKVDFIPHFHLVVDLKVKGDVKKIQEWVSRAWYEIVGSNNEKHLRAGTNVQAIYGNTSKLMSYLSKYLAKTFEVEINTGRVWGKWNKFKTLEPEVMVNFNEVRSFRLIRRGRGKYSNYLKKANIHNVRGIRFFSPEAKDLFDDRLWKKDEQE
jgi:hypothetical protein